MSATITLPSPRSSPPPRVLQLGLLPLADSAPLLVAERMGFFAAHGVRVELTVRRSWAALRDGMAFGQLDCGPMLTPMPIAAALGLGGVQPDLCVASTLSVNGNTVTLGTALLAEMAQGGLPAAVARRRLAGQPVPVLAVTYAFSTHHYLLRYWLASLGVDPEQDVRLVVVPPPQMPERLAEGGIDGFCAGEPWGSSAAALGCGLVVVTSADLLPDLAEKILVFPRSLVARERTLVVAVVAALIQAGRWIDAPDHRAATVRLLGETLLAGLPEAVVARALPGEGSVGRLRFGAARPDAAQGAWWLGQMRRWGHVQAAAADDEALIAGVWRDDLWAAALRLLDGPA